MNDNQSPPRSMHDVLHPNSDLGNDPNFPNSPVDWSVAVAETLAKDEGLALSNDHWEAIRALQEYFARHESEHINTRELQDALDEKFHAAGGIKALYSLFPQGPIAQGCRLAGLKSPAGSIDKGFGSVV